ncbi:methylated-DNA--[protein]-cysteine S-methyltransferase [Rugamonas sp.]|uniref:methylated-DNA--[protein]-cysteine S-methyltransferase n=1 Tax=Rugamonas sp. TaxID=1926287 RepID=UPI0025F29679|nr:methylated-DNA--[protein]-cysteine S-methyltransferase [Rugamonas sp.]
MEYVYMTMKSPVGELTLVARGDKLAAILWENDKPNRVRLGAMTENTGSSVLVETARQLGEYFAGARTQFDVALDFAGTEFQRQVWAALLTIPYGDTRSYSDIAHQIGRPAAVRAVGAANGKNPISIIAPCHRVIGMSGDLTGFAGGLHAKETLLMLEGAAALKREKRPASRKPEKVDHSTQGSLFDAVA